MTGHTPFRVLRHKFKAKKKHKYAAEAIVVDGIRFDSKKEAAHYRALKLRVAAGDVLFFLRQVPIHLTAGVKLVIDFQEFWADGSVHFVDTKGVQTEAFKIKKRQAEDLYPFEIEVI